MGPGNERGARERTGGEELNNFPTLKFYTWTPGNRYVCCVRSRVRGCLYVCAMGARRHGQEGALAPPPWKCYKMFLCISSYSKTPSSLFRQFSDDLY